MSQGKYERRRIRILVKAFPQPSQKYEETVCCAGVTEDTGELLRLYPIRYRRLDKNNQFERFDLVEMLIAKDSDPRPESYHVIEDSIKLVESGKKLSDQSKIQIWKPFISSSLKVLHKENKNENKSLGIIKPDFESIKFKIKLADKSNIEDKQIADLVYKQASLIEDPLKPIERPKYSFFYHYTCDGHSHKHQIHDWEVQAAFIKYKNRYGTEDEAKNKMTEMYQQIIPQRNLHLIMGTMKSHPQTFIVIGLLRTGFDPEELDKQGVLF